MVMMVVFFCWCNKLKLHLCSMSQKGKAQRSTPFSLFSCSQGDFEVILQSPLPVLIKLASGLRITLDGNPVNTRRGLPLPPWPPRARVVCLGLTPSLLPCQWRESQLGAQLHLPHRFLAKLHPLVWLCSAGNMRPKFSRSI